MAILDERTASLESTPAATVKHQQSYNAGMTLQEFFLKQKEAIRARTRDVFAMLRPDQMDWKPEKGALSIGELLRHLWVSEEGVRRCALNADFSYYEIRVPKGLHAVMGTPGSLDNELENADRVHRETITAVGALAAATFDEERTHDGLGFRRKVSVILYGINEHEVHHRAQLMTYLRIIGTPVPLKLAKK